MIKAEKIAVLILLSIGISARVAFPSHMSIEHFDEGVYASNIYCPQTGYRYPAAEFYAPPLLPALIEWSIIFTGPNIGPFIFPLLFSIGTLVLVWHVARQWISPRAGLCALALASLSDFHIHYSRMALTDATMCFFLLLAVYLIGEALSKSIEDADSRLNKPKPKSKRSKADSDVELPPNANVWCVAAGLAAACCWWTKYNGWLPIAIMIGGVGGWTALHSLRDRTSLKSRIGLVAKSCLVIVVVAFLVWLPFLYSLPDGRTYADISANHGKYLVGITGWIDSFKQHAAHHQELNGWITLLSIAVVMVSCELRKIDFKNRSIWNAIVMIVALTFCGHQTHPMLLVVLWCIIVALRFLVIQCKRDFDHSPTAIRTWLLISWWVGLFLTTPLYWPYPRLSLPFLVASWLLLAQFVSVYAEIIKERSAAFDEPSNSTGWFKFAGSKVVGILFLLMLIIVLSSSWSERDLATAFEDRSSARELVKSITDEEKPTLALVYGEPALLFHLSAAGVPSVPISSLSNADENFGDDVKPIVVVGPHARSNPDFAKELAAADFLKLKRTFEITRSPVVLANQLEDDASPKVVIHIYETTN